MKGLKTVKIMCTAMIITAIPMAAFAQEPDKTLEPYELPIALQIFKNNKQK